MQWLKGISSPHQLAGAVAGVPALAEEVWERRFWARGYMAVSSGTITDEMNREYIDEQEGEQIADDSRFPIDSQSTHRLKGESRSV